MGHIKIKTSFSSEEVQAEANSHTRMTDSKKKRLADEFGIAQRAV